MMSKRRDEEEKDKAKERGAKDDLEALKMVLDEHPTLKQRVLRRMREIKNRNQETAINISRQAQQDYRRESKKKKQPQ